MPGAARRARGPNPPSTAPCASGPRRRELDGGGVRDPLSPGSGRIRGPGRRPVHPPLVRRRDDRMRRDDEGPAGPRARPDGGGPYGARRRVWLLPRPPRMAPPVVRRGRVGRLYPALLPPLQRARDWHHRARRPRGEDRVLHPHVHRRRDRRTVRGRHLGRSPRRRRAVRNRRREGRRRIRFRFAFRAVGVRTSAALLAEGGFEGIAFGVVPILAYGFTQKAVDLGGLFSLLALGGRSLI